MSFVTKYFGTNTVIVFDGYNESSKNTKNTERNRRVKNISADILFDENTVVIVTQTPFLSNMQKRADLSICCLHFWWIKGLLSNKQMTMLTRLL